MAGRVLGGSCVRFLNSGNRLLRKWPNKKLSLFLLSNRKIHATRPRFQRSNKSEGDMPDKDSALVPFMILVAGATMYFFLRKGEQRDEELHFVPWKSFVQEMLAKGEVEEIIIRPDSDVVTIRLKPNAIIKGEYAMRSLYHLRIPDVHHFEENLRKAEEELGIPSELSVSVIYQRASDWTFILIALAVTAFMVVHYMKSTGKVKGVGFSSMDLFDNVRKAKYRLVEPFIHSGKPSIKFADVVGLREAKIEVKEFVDYLQRPEAYTKLGAKLPKGALLLGPPGCGKTLLAKAVSSEASVPFLAINGTEFVEIIGGLGAARVRDLFKEAKRKKPCIIYIDEIDAIGRKRSGVRDVSNFQNGEEEQTLNQLLVEMDGMDSSQGVIVMASTNRPDILDGALLRRGRFDRHITIDLPSLAERKEIFEYYLKKIKLKDPPETYSDHLTFQTPGFSGADIMNVCNEAAIHAASNKKGAVCDDDLSYALDRVLTGSEKRSNTMTVEEKEKTAYHESGHALVGWFLKYTDALVKMSIIPRTKMVPGMGFSQYATQERRLFHRQELFDKMCMALGGRAAENVIYGTTSTAAEDDLRKVTRIAYDQVKIYGMNKTVGPLSFPTPAEKKHTDNFWRKPYSSKLQRVMDLEAKNLVSEAYFKAEQILREHTEQLKNVAEKLLKQEVLTYDETVELLGPPPHGHKKKTVAEFQLPEVLSKETTPAPSSPES